MTTRRPPSAPWDVRFLTASSISHSPRPAATSTTAPTGATSGWHTHSRALIKQLDPEWLTDAVRRTGYHPQGLPALRDALAGYLATTRLRVAPDGILVTTGAQQAITLAAPACCPPGSTVLVEEATYPGTLETFQRLGLRILPIPTDPHGPDPQALAAILTQTRAGLVYLAPVGNNPTGIIIPGERLDLLAEVLSQSTAVLLEDRTAAPLADQDTVPAPLATRLPRGTAMVVGSMSKIVWAGVRVGWLLAPPGILRAALAAWIAADLASSSSVPATRRPPHALPSRPGLRRPVRPGRRPRGTEDGPGRSITRLDRPPAGGR